LRRQKTPRPLFRCPISRAAKQRNHRSFQPFHAAAAIIDAGATVTRAWLDAGMLLRTALLFALLAVAFVLATAVSLQPPSAFLPDDPRAASPVARTRYTDRAGTPLNETLANAWNLHARLPLHEIPPLLQAAMITAEDQRFWQHHGADWMARAHAAVQNLRAGRVVRGASTISEQVVRLLQPRPRDPWSRWLEGWEAWWLEARFGKPALLEFYFNQVPYAAQRRGVLAAARHHFGRDLDTLNARELLTLAVLVRSPAGMGLDTPRARDAVRRLAAQLRAQGEVLPPDAVLLAQPLSRPLPRSGTDVDASAFISALRAWPRAPAGVQVRSTLDAHLQAQVQKLLSAQLRLDSDLDVRHAAALVVDWRSNEILAWAVATRDGDEPTRIDAVRVRRQPGSTLKPFVYAQAFERGWTPSTMILDAPLEQLVGSGMHEYRNYSRVHYGWISARDALGNSLNVPAVKAAQAVGTPLLLQTLRSAGIASLREHPGYYGDGLALGNGEVTLYELVSAYATLARGGVYRPFTPFRRERAGFSSRDAGGEAPRRVVEADAASLAGNEMQTESSPVQRRVWRAETASLIADILSDDAAREREFGRGGVLAFPVQTAVKTGTSSDYRDAWTLAFNDCCVVGAWFGNLDYQPMRDITGARGPAPVVRQVVAELNRARDTRALARHPALRRERVCIDSGERADAACEARDDWFAPWMTPGAWADGDTRVRIRKPAPGLRLAMDPRISDDAEGFEFRVQAPQDVTRVRWWVNGELAGESEGERFVWLLRRGHHAVSAEVWLAGAAVPTRTEPVPFDVR
jgi:penicillin-binding protein 1C